MKKLCAALAAIALACLLAPHAYADADAPKPKPRPKPPATIEQMLLTAPATTLTSNPPQAPAQTPAVEVMTTAPASGGLQGIAKDVQSWFGWLLQCLELLLGALLAGYGTVIGTVITNWIVKLAQQRGYQLDDQARARLKEMVTNALHIVAAKMPQSQKDAHGNVLAGALNVLLDGVVGYVEAQGAGTLKLLGAPAGSPEAEDAIRAHALVKLADPSVSVSISTDASAAGTVEPVSSADSAPSLINPQPA